MTDSIDLQALRDQVRSDRHATSYPLIVVGAVGFYYASNALRGWIPAIFGLPLAFVVVWALQLLHERRTGVGRGHDEVLAVAFAVFLATTLTMSDTWLALLPGASGDFHVIWLLGPTAAGLVAIGLRQRSRSLVLWGVGIAAMCALGDTTRDSSLRLRWSDYSTSYQTFLPQVAFLAASLVGLFTFWMETGRAE